jgi:uncharacterized alkaline shock family protein YloU
MTDKQDNAAQETRLGRVDVTPVAIASIAGQAVLNSYGVVGFATPSGRGGLVDSLYRDHSKRAVEISIVGDEIIIDVYVIIEYGTRIAAVAYNIMRAVKFSVEKALGVPVSEVNVHVQGVRVSSSE